MEYQYINMVLEKFCVFGESDKKTYFSQLDLNQAKHSSTVPHQGFDPEVEQHKCATGEETGEETNALPLNMGPVCHSLTWLKGGIQPFITA